MKRTKGPWKVISENGMTYIVDDEDRTVSSIPKDHKDGGTEFGDAHLIACAPEMLSLLMKLEKFDPKYPDYDGQGDELQEAIETLIKKAKGEV